MPQDTYQSFYVTKFMEKLGRGMRSNLYSVEVVLPTALQSQVDPSFSENIAFMARSTRAPGFTLGVAEVPFAGRQVKLDGDRTFEDWTMTVYVDSQNEGNIRDAFVKWTDVIDGTVLGDTSLSTNAIEYMGTAMVNMLDKNRKVIRSYSLHGIWPSEVGPIELAFDSNDEVATFDVTFAVNWVEMANVTRNNTTTE